ncbi:hypothetical protein ACFLIN_10235 [Corynebacterium kutscheri]|nr:hypothetical protein [Corynebacterium kutscheri]
MIEKASSAELMIVSTQALKCSYSKLCRAGRQEGNHEEKRRK